MTGVVLFVFNEWNNNRTLRWHSWSLWLLILYRLFVCVVLLWNSLAAQQWCQLCEEKSSHQYDWLAYSLMPWFTHWQTTDCCFVVIGHQVIPQSFAAAAKNASPVHWPCIASATLVGSLLAFLNQPVRYLEEYYAMHWPRIRRHAASAGVWLRAGAMEISGPLRLRKGLFYFVV